MSSSEEEEEEFLVLVEFNGMLEKDILDKAPVSFKMIGVNDKRPVMQIGNQTFAGEYRDIVGTALLFEEDPTPSGGDPVFSKLPEHQLRYFCKTRKSLQMTRVFLNKKDSPEETDTDGNSTNKNQESASEKEHAIEVDEFPTQVDSKKTREPEPEPVAGPSHILDIPSTSTSDLGVLMEATKLNVVTAETARIVEEQIKITTDNLVGAMSDSDSLSDE